MEETTGICLSVKLVQLLRGHITRSNDASDSNKAEKNGEHWGLQK